MLSQIVCCDLKRAGFGFQESRIWKVRSSEREGGEAGTKGENLGGGKSAPGSLAISRYTPNFALRAATPAKPLKTSDQFFFKACEYRPTAARTLCEPFTY